MAIETDASCRRLAAHLEINDMPGLAPNPFCNIVLVTFALLL